MCVMTAVQQKALALLDEGADFEGLVRVLYYPRDPEVEPGEVVRLTTPLPAGADLSGLPGNYYLVGRLAYPFQ